MSFADWDKKDIEVAEKGLNLLGWQLDLRLTSDDSILVNEVALIAIEKSNASLLTYDLIEELSKKVFQNLRFQIMNTEERARMVCARYNKSTYLSALIPLIDESLLCFYRGYYTASLSLLFITLENCLRSIAGWKPGDQDISFATLRDSVKKLPNTSHSQLAYNIVKIIYSRFDATNPPQFYFNRHGLLHGMRSQLEVDIMNCCRIYQLFDIICSAENIGNSIYGKDLEDFRIKENVYHKCVLVEEEQNILKNKI
jgi:hypothetical protein